MTILSQEQRAASLEAMTSQKFDVLVIGGGVTGAGIALDAASRGLSIAVIEGQDWASGTSSRSSRLVHGGLRYLYNLDFKLVAEALRERGRLLTTIAPHLVEAQPFLWPLKHHYERSYSAVGVGMYDALALAGSRGRKTVPIQRHLGRKGTSALAQAKALHPDVILMDVRMPGMNGIEATERIAQECPGTRVLILTTFDLDEYAFAGLRAGASGFLLKDTRPTELAEAIRTVASGEAVVSPRITQRMLEMFAASLPSSDAPEQSSSDPRIESLTPREKEILVLMSQGMSNAEIAAHLVVSATTVKTHVGNVLAKLDVRDRVQAVVVAYETGLMA